MSAIGPKWISLAASHMSTFGGRADTTFAAQMSVFDPKGTSLAPSSLLVFTSTMPCRDRRRHEVARVHCGSWRRDGGRAVDRARAVRSGPADWRARRLSRGRSANEDAPRWLPARAGTARMVGGP